MSLHDAMKPGNGKQVRRLIATGQDINSLQNDLTVLQYAAKEYYRTSEGLTKTQKQLHILQWKHTISPLTVEKNFTLPNVSLAQWLGDTVHISDVRVDLMLDDLGFIKSEVKTLSE